MIDGLYKPHIDKMWNAAAQVLAWMRLTPNQVTCIGLLLVLANCAAYLYWRSTLLFGVGLSISFAFDALDGAVARLRGMASKFGGYLDAVIDRYQDIAVFATIAMVEGWWIECFFAATGAMLISYNKARVAVEMPIDNDKWPDLLERFERIVILCAALILDSFFALPDALGGRVLYLAVLLLAVFSHLTAVQRFFRARNRLNDYSRF